MTEDSTTTPAYIWFDTEYSDLDLDRAQLLQVAAMATDAQLKRLHPPDQDINMFIRLDNDSKVSPWVEEHLPNVVTVCRSEQAVAVAKADLALQEWLARVTGHISSDRKSRPVLAGNSIHADWFLARRYLPGFISRLHYRVLDVTALKLIWQDWYRGEKFDKENRDLVRQSFPGVMLDSEGRPHDALYDIHASIAELNFYRSRLARERQTPGLAPTSSKTP